jgi:predicted AAA+ superfamily ATPase
VVFVELLRRHFKPGLDLFYYRTRNDREIDFLCRKGHVVEQLIQVCYDISYTKTLNREIAALLEAGSETNCKKLLLVTWDREELLERSGNVIELIPAWKWLCGE